MPETTTPAAPAAHDERKRISTTVSPRTMAALDALSRAWDDLPLGRVLDRLLTEETRRTITAEDGKL